MEGLSPRTLTSYQDQLQRFQEYIGDIPIASINALHIEDFLYWLHTDYHSERVGFESKSLSAKTLYNYWVAVLAEMHIRSEFPPETRWSIIPALCQPIG